MTARLNSLGLNPQLGSNNERWGFFDVQMELEKGGWPEGRR